MSQSIGFSIVGIIIGIFIGWCLRYFRQQSYFYQQQNNIELLKKEHEQLTEQLTHLRHELSEKEKLISHYDHELRKLIAELAASKEKITQQQMWMQDHEQIKQAYQQLQQINTQLTAELSEIKARFTEFQLAATEKQQLLMNSEQRLTTQFENLANRIFENSHRTVNEQNQHSLNQLLMPLKEQLDGFKRQMNDSFGQEAKERFSLTNEIKNLQQLNAKMANEALNLTKALKGDNKRLGNWGEVVLSRVLEASGLREGYEFETQVNIKIDAHNRMQPDVIVRLPQNKDVVIDAKVSLVAYDRYFNSDDEQERKKWLKEHISSIRNHLKLLSSKDYHQLPAVKSLDYVLMFIPIEPAFLSAIDNDPSLINEALQQNVMLVSPTTLLVALRTIANLWRYEHQSQNAQRIAFKASRLYDKLRLFISEMEGLGQNLARAQTGYHQAMNKLVEGRGNLVSQVEGFRALGVEVKRPINSVWLDKAKQNDDAFIALEDEQDPLDE